MHPALDPVGSPPQPTSNVPAIIAVIGGSIAVLIGWIPVCGSIPGLILAVAGVALGIWGLSIAKRGPRLGKGLPVTGLVLSLLGLALSAFSTAMPAFMVVQAGQAREAERAAEAQRRETAAGTPAPFRDAAIYVVSSDNHLAGTGFIVQTDAGLFAITAEHPFNGETPRAFHGPALEDGMDVDLGPVVWRGEDVQALRLATGAAPTGPTLRYPGPISLQDGDRVIVLTPDGSVPATVTDAPGNILHGSASPDTPVAAAGLSGAPVVLEATGTPVGVLLSANDPERATLLGFAKLRMPADPTIRSRERP